MAFTSFSRRSVRSEACASSGTQLRLRPVDVDGRRDLRIQPAFREAQRVAIDPDRVFEQPDLIVEAAKVDVVSCKLCVQFEPRLREGVRARLGAGRRRARDIPDPAPDVDLVGDRAAEQVVAEIVRLSERAERPVRRLLVRGYVAQAVDLRKKSRKRRLRLRLSGVIGGDRRGEVGIRRFDIDLEEVHSRTVETLPPRLIRRQIQSGRRRILEFCREGDARRRITGRKIAPAQAQRNRRRQPRRL